jgi:integrase
VKREQLTPDRIRRYTCPRGKAQAFYWDAKAPRLAVRVTRGGAKTFVFEKKLTGRTLRVSIGDVTTWPLNSVWDGKGDERREIQRGAREEANRLEALVDQGGDPRVEAAALRAAENARRAALVTEAEAGQYTLDKLLAVYVAHLRKQAKSSAGAVENCILNHVTIAHPEIARKPANAVTAHDVVSVLRPLTEAGKGRTAGKLRAYLRAAFARAAKAALDPKAPAAFLPFQVQSNPVAATETLAEFNLALDRTLSEPELREYMKTLTDAPDSPTRDALLLGLLLGGQRIAQLLRATVADADVTARTLRLFDPKGNRKQPRSHVLPLSDPALVIVKRCIARAESQRERAESDGETDTIAGRPLHLFSTHGDAPLRGETVTNAATEIAAALRRKPKAERVVYDPFQLRDIRRTCETRLAELGISRDLRAQIQSHGLGGIQAKHYDRHDYMQEKRAALASWAAYLTRRPAANVKTIGDRARRRA